MTPSTNYDVLCQILNYKFNDINLLNLSLTHRSYPNESTNHYLGQNERLEFLGDAIIEFLTSEYLYIKYPDVDEGILTLYRSSLVRTEQLHKTAISLNLQDYLLMSKGEISLGNNVNPSIMADAFESIIGAIYLDSHNLEFLKLFLSKHLWCYLDEIIETKAYIDSKTRLQTIIQNDLKQTPYYDIINQTGKDHNKSFVAVVKIGDKVLGTGKGKSKQIAEQSAAEDALRNKNF